MINGGDDGILIKRSYKVESFGTNEEEELKLFYFRVRHCIYFSLMKRLDSLISI